MIVLAPATRFGFETDLWTVQRVHRILNDRGHEEVSLDTVWRRLQDIGLTWQTPEREYRQVDAAWRREWQENILPEIRQTLRETKGILYCEDEASISLTPVHRERSGAWIHPKDLREAAMEH